MSEKLEKLEFFKAYVKPESIEKGEPVYVIEPEFIKWVILHAQFFLERYEKAHPEIHWTNKQQENTRIGLAGQKAFEMLLQHMEIFYIPNDPIVDRRLQKPYDFKLAIGTVEVKTLPYYAEKVMIKAKEWHGNDYLIVWKFMDKTNLKLALIGWLTKNQVEAYPIIPKGKSKYTQYASARVIPIKELNSPATLLKHYNYS